MSTNPKTIDNLGLETSVRWATDQESKDTKIISESRSVPLKTEVAITEPFYSSQIEELFSYNKKNISFAKFQPPKGYHSHQLPLFTYQILPSIGTYEKQEANKEKMVQMKHEKEGKKKHKDQEDDQEDEIKLKEIDCVANMLDKLGILDKYLNVINARRQQYHKG